MIDIKDEIREYIYSGAGTPGAILSEREIAQQFNLKRNNTRELLLALEGEGVVTRHPQKGYSYVNYDSTDLETILIMRYVIEHEAVYKAMTRATREDLVRLTLIFEEMDQHANARDLAQFAKADMDFHTALIAASHDNMLIKIFDFMKATLFRRKDMKSSEFTPLFERTQLVHRELFDAFKAKNWEVVDAALHRHLAGHPSIQQFKDRF